MINAYMITENVISFSAPTFFESLPNKMLHGMATTCVTTSARIMPMEPSPSVSPYFVAMEMIVSTPSI